LALSFVVSHDGVADILRTGLERATSCHDHDGFQTSPRQFSKGAVHVDVAPEFIPRFALQFPEEKNHPFTIL